MFTVSCCKAFLVIAFFMHMRWEANWKYVLTIPTSIMAIFLMIMLTPDILFRTLRFAEERLQFDAQAVVAHPHSEEHGPASHGGGHTDKESHEGESKTGPSDGSVLRLAYSVSETATMLGVCDKTVRRLVHRGLLRPSRAIRHLLISRKEIDRFLEETG